MGFDFTIGVALALDPNEGTPYVWDGTGNMLPYNVTEYRLPSKFLRFAKMRGHHIHFYTRIIEEKRGLYHCTANIFLHHFPSWPEIKNDSRWEDYDWSEADHTLFRECVAWCAEKRCYEFSWSW